jgi:YHS domain-containing protein
MRCEVCSEEVSKEKSIRLEYHLFGGERVFCSMACLLKFLSEACPKSYKIAPTEIALLGEKARKVWLRSKDE